MASLNVVFTIAALQLESPRQVFDKWYFLLYLPWQRYTLESDALKDVVESINKLNENPKRILLVNFIVINWF
ncbi:hypothetical protein BAA08_09705 [Bizionia sp. APA-3]|nr:hypothetical protein BAA08_09705 [Bizionia sp. APA-3]